MKKLLLILFILLFFVSSAFATNWENTNNKKGSIVFIDTDSIVKTSTGTFFNIMYYSKQAKEQMICLVYMIGNQAKIVKTMKLSEYTPKQMSYKKVFLDKKVAKEFDENSSIYNACIIASQKAKNMKAVNYKPRFEEQNTNISRNCSNINYSSNEKDVDFKPYMNELQRKIKLNWSPPKGNESKNVIVLFKISKDGQLLSSKIQKTSGSFAVDRAALKAVQLAAPFKPLPINFNEESIDIQFSFDYNVI